MVVFNTPGANANAVKELVLAALFASGRKLAESLEWVNSLAGKGDEIPSLVEKGKKNFVGHELLGKTIGVIGLGAIGAKVANATEAIGMKVLGYDPYLSVDNALSLTRKIKRAATLDEIAANADYITVHVPLLADNKGFLNKEFFAKMKDGAVLINLARGELANNDDVLEAVESGKLSKYVCDFPCEKLIGKKNVLCFPHLGASTPEAEDNCAVMAAKQLADYALQNHGSAQKPAEHDRADLLDSGKGRHQHRKLRKQKQRRNGVYHFGYRRTGERKTAPRDRRDRRRL